MKRKGFTVSEILGVIVVLSVIALIAVPTVLGVIEKAKRESFRESVKNAFDQLEKYLVEKNLDKVGEEGVEVSKIGLSEGSFETGIFKVTEEEKVEVINISDGNYCGVGEREELEIYKGKCDLTVPTCELRIEEEIGSGGWYFKNPEVTMETSMASTGGLKYGIGKEENYEKRVESGKRGKASYQTEGEGREKVYCYVQNIGREKGTNEIEVKIDKTEPSEATFSYTTTSKSITVTAGGKDEESGLSRYQFSKDNGETWTNIQRSNVYTFDNLKYQEYEIKVRVYNGTYIESGQENNLRKESMMRKVSPEELKVPTYEVNPSEWTKEEVRVTIKYGEEGVKLFRTTVRVESSVGVIPCESVIDGKYQCGGEQTSNIEENKWYQVEGNPTLTLSENGSIVSQVVDGVNYKMGSSITVGNIDKEKPEVEIREVRKVEGENGWNKEVKLRVEVSKIGVSGVEEDRGEQIIYYCKTTEEKCIPELKEKVEEEIEILSNSKAERICSKVRSKSGMESEIKCSEGYKVDKDIPQVEVKEVEVINGENGWKKKVRLKIETTNVGKSGFSRMYYCITGGSTCTPGTEVQSTSKEITLGNVSSNQKVCVESRSNAGVRSEIKCSEEYKVDGEAPSVPNVKYIAGTSSTLWQKDIRMTLTSIDNVSGIKAYEIDWGNSNTANATTGPSFTPSNGWSSSVTRFRAVDNAGNRSNWTVAYAIHLDKTAPVVRVSVSGRKVTIYMSDALQLGGYNVTTSTQVPTSWSSISGTSIEKTWEASAAGTYYVHVKDQAGNTAYTSFKIDASAICAYTPGQVVKTFSYTGGVQGWSAPCSGVYKLEVWGSQGGTSNSLAPGANGGYAYGNKSLNKGTALYVVVGGIPYNGGGAPASNGYYNATYGGGATHIATTNRGVLSNYASYKGEVIIVAGGGGGSVYQTYLGEPMIGGTGGGVTGGNVLSSWGSILVPGGTQSAGGSLSWHNENLSGSFGQGGTSYTASCGGGGGWYGGAAGSDYYGGGGGSGYLNPSHLISGSTGMQNGTKTGYGSARITLVSLSN